MKNTEKLSPLHKILLGNEEYWCLDELTARFCHKEIFNDHDYLKHGIAVHPGDVVLDIGANIGLFTRYLARFEPKAVIYAFEPVPDIYAALLKNTKNLANIRCYNTALGKSDGEADIYFFPNVSADSAFVRVDIERKLKGFLENYTNTVCFIHPLARFIPKFLRPYIVKSTYSKMYKYTMRKTSMTTLSAWIDREAIQNIDLIKLDVENYELEVLRGIEDRHWQIIRQITMEVHAHIKGGELVAAEINKLLTTKGFHIKSGEADAKSSVGVYMLYAKRV